MYNSKRDEMVSGVILKLLRSREWLLCKRLRQYQTLIPVIPLLIPCETGILVHEIRDLTRSCTVAGKSPFRVSFRSCFASHLRGVLLLKQRTAVRVMLLQLAES